MIPRNVKSIINTPYQSDHLKVVCVCSGGVLRSPTMAKILTMPPFNFNTRSCGTEDYALVIISQSLVYWADIIVCAETYHRSVVESVMDNAYEVGEVRPPIFTMNIPDEYDYCDPVLVDIATEKLKRFFNVEQNPIS